LWHVLCALRQTIDLLSGQISNYAILLSLRAAKDQELIDPLIGDRRVDERYNDRDFWRLIP
jgi:hypothetical protein